MPTTYPIIPETVTVHLGPPGSNAPNVTVSFPDYIKNVASSEIYPTWPKEALRANILAQISFALNRIFTEHYPAQGYDFDITNSTAFDQSFVQGRDIFENISDIVDNIFNDYLRRPGSIEPLFAQYCNGTTVTCEGLSQWGTVPLAESGMSAVEILQSFYGPDIEIVENAPVAEVSPSYPNIAFRLGDSSPDIEEKQLQLNRISRNYPSIPKIPITDGNFESTTEAAVKAFQSIFGLEPDGIIGKATWYKISFIYNAVKRLSELDSEGISFSELPQNYVEELVPGDTGIQVELVQYYLSVISAFYDTVPNVDITGVYDAQTENAVRAFQQTYGLTETGSVNFATWRDIYRAYRGIVVDNPQLEGGTLRYPGLPLRFGSRGEYVTALQEYLNEIAKTYPSIPTFPVTGYFGTQTENAVIAFQNAFGFEPTGSVNPFVWDAITSLYSDLTLGFQKQEGQNPGTTLSESS